MSPLGFKSTVYHGELRLGELDVVSVTEQNFQFPNNEIRIHHLSPSSERCSPLSILQTISPFSVRCKLESSSLIEQHHLIKLHAACFHEVKTAVVLLGGEEIHLVAMPSRQKKFPCFWCYSAPTGLYTASLGMLNPRCLAIVFDLDETLIVANTMKSFEDKIDALRNWIAREPDPARLSGMSAELKRYMDDRALLKQYCEGDSIADNGKVFKVQMEEIPPLADNHEKVFRPVIRLQEKNIVLTRINPEIRDTSVLVRLRPAWEDLRNYLTAKGRKRFEVYVCTMAERDYALEMWRLLDPEAHLIGLKQLGDRIFCVKSGSRKSLLNVFQYGMCHPKMAMVIDDRLKVWEEKDQPRVHVVPPFSPYYAPQAETAHPVPVLCVARNVACNVRGWFYREFDEVLLRKISEVSYEDDMNSLPHAPDVSHFMMSEDAGFVPNGNLNAAVAEGISNAEGDRRTNQLDENKVTDSASLVLVGSADSRSEISQLPAQILSSATGVVSSGSLLPSQKPGLLGPPVRRDFLSPENYDTRRRFLPMKHATDVRTQSSSEPPLLSRLPSQIPAAPPQGLLVEEGINKVHISNRLPGIGQESDSFRCDKQRAYQNPFNLSSPYSTTSGLFSGAPQIKDEEVFAGPEVKKPVVIPSDVGALQNQVSSNSRDFQNEVGKSSLQPPTLCISALQEIGVICSSKVEFRPVSSNSKELQFSVEVFFGGEKIGVGMGKTRKEAQQAAAENSLRGLADGYVAHITACSGAVGSEFDKNSLGTDNGFLWDDVHPVKNSLIQEDGLPKESTSEATEVAFGAADSNVANQQEQRHANCPRLSESNPNKQSKEEQSQSSEVASSPSQQKNTSSVSHNNRSCENDGVR